VDRLAILNAAHPRKLSEGLHHPGQLRKSWYFFFFDLPDLPESVVHANDWHFFRHFLRDARPAYTPQEFDRYIEAWSQPGAATGMINYYRFSVRESPKKAEAALRPIAAPTLVIWDERATTRAPSSPSPATTTSPTCTASNACPTPPTGSTTTKPTASTSSSSTSSPPPGQARPDQGTSTSADRPGRAPDAALLLTLASVALIRSAPWGPAKTRPAPPARQTAPSASESQAQAQRPGWSMMRE